MKKYIAMVILETVADDELEVHQEIGRIFEKTEFRVTDSIVCENKAFSKIRYGGF